MCVFLLGQRECKIRRGSDRWEEECYERMKGGGIGVQPWARGHTLGFSHTHTALSRWIAEAQRLHIENNLQITQSHGGRDRLAPFNPSCVVKHRIQQRHLRCVHFHSCLSWLIHSSQVQQILGLHFLLMLCSFMWTSSGSGSGQMYLSTETRQCQLFSYFILNTNKPANRYSLPKICYTVTLRSPGFRM